MNGTDIVGTSLQSLVFLALFAAGTASAALYAICFLLRRAFGFAKAPEIIIDLLFTFASAADYFFVLFLSNGGEMRLYTFLGFLAGFFSLYLLLKPLTGLLPKIDAAMEKAGAFIRKIPVIGRIFK